MELTKEDKELIKKFDEFGKKKCVSERHSVAAILVSKSGKIYEGTSMEFDCGVGVCAERVALFKMMPDESEIKIIVAGYKDKIGPPCGVCRELMYEMNKKNLDKPMMPSELVMKIYKSNSNTYFNLVSRALSELKELYPYDWQKAFGRK